MPRQDPRQGHPAQPGSLILSEQPVARVQLLGRPILRAGVTAVYSTQEGKLEDLGRLLTFGEAMSGRYKTMYEVDISHHECTVSTGRDPLPAKSDRFFFAARVDIGWQVTDPVKVVREGVRDGEQVVVRRVMDAMRKVGRKYEITDCDQVELEINELYDPPVRIFGYGLTIDHVSAHVTRDDVARDHLRQQAPIEHQTDPGARGHALDGATPQQELERERMRAVAAGVRGEFGLLTAHLRHHPDQTLQVLRLMHARQQELEQRQEAVFRSSDEMFRTMIDAGLIENADIEDIRDRLLRNTPNMATGAPPSNVTAAPGPHQAAPPVAAPAAPPVSDLTAPPAVVPAAPPVSDLTAPPAVVPAAPPSNVTAAPGPHQAAPPAAAPAAALAPDQTAAPADPTGVAGWRKRRPAQSRPTSN
ncbi:hypothetical protein AB0J72_08750 [Dactylosporangium sp. NPDC049742]|uniref:hypothetical protein n=1 Tax=Dactylosporangium sp. NPDC049742 TaxID=3154737 RepID=UPI003432138B